MCVIINYGRETNMKRINLDFQQLNSHEIKIIAGGQEFGCNCYCKDSSNDTFRVDCVPGLKECNYVCKDILSIQVEKCVGQCNSTNFYKRYPDPETLAKLLEL